MRTIIAGCRDIGNMGFLKYAIAECGWTPTVVLCGGAPGVDLLGKRWAEENGIPVEMYPADWARYGRHAGLVRNGRMARNAEALVAVWDGRSRGTGHMIRLAERHGLRKYVFMVPGVRRDES